MRLRDKLARIAAVQLNIGRDEVRFADGKIFAAANPDNAVTFTRLAGTSHWSPGSLPDPDAAALREAPVILHRETSSPVTPLGAKGVGEGNSMSTPVCLANAVADALGVADLTLPLTPSRVAALLRARGKDV